MVEVECHSIVSDAEHRAYYMLPLVVEHWHTCAELQKLLTQTTVGCDKDILGHVDYGFGYALAVSFIGCEGEGKGRARCEPLYGCLEGG